MRFQNVSLLVRFWIESSAFQLTLKNNRQAVGELVCDIGKNFKRVKRGLDCQCWG